MNTLKSNAVHMKFSMEQKGISEFSLGTSESEADERYLLICRNKSDHSSSIKNRFQCGFKNGLQVGRKKT